MTGGVQHGESDDGATRLIHLVEDAVGKSIRIAPAQVSTGMLPDGDHWILRQASPHYDDLLDEGSTQTETTQLV